MTKQFTLLALTVCTVATTNAQNRSYSGVGNSADDRGAANQPYIRIADADYGDGLSTLAGAMRPSAREVSNILSAQSFSERNDRRGSDFIWLWGQFVDHDITFTPAKTGEDASILVPDVTDLLYPIIPLERSEYEVDSDGVRQQINGITSFVDASSVYGSDPATALALRTLSGGKMKVAADGLLPFNHAGLPMDSIGLVPSDELRMAGDVRANEQPGLTALHTLFVHEHNRLADEIAWEHKKWNDERIYQRARKLVGAIIQSITYNEWLPALLGPAAPDPHYFTYDPDTDPTVSNEFATALFRFGHSLVSPRLMLIRDNNHPASPSSVSLADSFFYPPVMSSRQRYEQFLKGFASQQHQAYDARIIDELRNALFGAPGSGGLDLAALNIQRGREHGLPDYNSVRSVYGLNPISSWAEISSDPTTQFRFAHLYRTYDNIDLWPAALSEDPLPGAAVGELMAVGIASEFTRLAEGDAFFYLWDPKIGEYERHEITYTTLHDVIGRNTSLTLQKDVFVVPEADFRIESCEYKPGIGIVITFIGEPGYEYQLKYGDNPGVITEDLLLTPATTGNATYLITVVDPDGLGPQRRFYKGMRTVIDPSPLPASPSPSSAKNSQGSESPVPTKQRRGTKG